MSLEHMQDYKNSMYEPSSRVPLIIVPVNVSSIPAPPAGGALISNITSHIDIVPTLAELAGVAPIPGARGQSLLPFIRAAASSASTTASSSSSSSSSASTAPAAPAAAAVRDYAVIEYHSNLAATGSFGIVQGPWKLIVYGHTWPIFNATAYVPQLFHTATDPYEISNVAPENPDIVASLTALLEKELAGGQAGGLQAIDAAQMQQNLQLYNDWFFSRCNGTELVRAFTSSFRGVSPDELDAMVTAWSGRSPSEATGPGGRCPAGGDGLSEREFGM